MALTSSCSSADYLFNLSLTNTYIKSSSEKLDNTWYFLKITTDGSAGRDTNAFNISHYVDPWTTVPYNATWTYMNVNEIEQMLPLDRPISIECPMSVCVFPISGYYGALQRYLLYFSIVAGFLAITLRIRSLSLLAILWSTTFGLSACCHLLVMAISNSVPWNLITDLDFSAASLVAFVGCYSAAVYFIAHLDIREWKSKTDRNRLEFSATVISVVCSCALMFATVYCTITGTAEMQLPAVLLKSPEEYRVAGPCYVDTYGAVKLWSLNDMLLGHLRTGRQASDISPYYFASNRLVDYQTETDSPRLSDSPLTIRQLGTLDDGPLAPHVQWYTSFQSPLLPLPFRYLTAAMAAAISVAIVCSCSRWPSRKIRCYLVLTIFSVEMIWAIVTYELAVNKFSTPTSEGNLSIGQWGPWVAAGYILALATIVHLGKLLYKTIESGSMVDGDKASADKGLDLEASSHGQHAVDTVPDKDETSSEPGEEATTDDNILKHPRILMTRTCTLCSSCGLIHYDNDELIKAEGIA